QRHSGRRHTADASGRRRNVPIAEAAHGFDRLEAVRYLAELPPEVRDVQLHLVPRDTCRVAPHMLDELVGGEHVAGMLDQRGEEAELWPARGAGQAAAG